MIISAVEATIHDRDAARNIRRMVVDDGVRGPVGRPVSASPTVGVESSNNNARRKPNGAEYCKAANGSYRNGSKVKRWVNRHGCAVHDPRVICRDIYNGWVRRLNDYVSRLIDHGLLRRGAKIARCIRSLTHPLNGGHDILRLVVVSVAQLVGPIKIAIKARENGWKRRQRLNTRIPWLGVYLAGE